MAGSSRAFRRADPIAPLEMSRARMGQGALANLASCAACLSGCPSRAPGCWCGSGGLAAPALFEFLEAEGCDYAVAMAKNKRLV